MNGILAVHADVVSVPMNNSSHDSYVTVNVRLYVCKAVCGRTWTWGGELCMEGIRRGSSAFASLVGKCEGHWTAWI